MRHRRGTVAGLVLAVLAFVAPARAGDGRVFEKDTTLDEVARVASILRAHGLVVTLTRTSDVLVPLGTRAAAGAGADLFLSIHNNAGPPATHGTEIYSQLNNDYGARVARTLLARVSAAAGTTPRFSYARPGAHGDYYAVLRGNRATALIVEGAYLSNPGEARALADPEFRQRLANGIADGVLAEFAALPHPQGDGPGPPPQDSGHTILPAPANVAVALASSGRATVTWEATSALITGYRLWRDGNYLGDVDANATSASDGVTGAGVHHYEVRSFLTAGPVEFGSPTAAADLLIPWRIVLDAGHGGRDPGAIGHV